MKYLMIALLVLASAASSNAASLTINWSVTTDDVRRLHDQKFSPLSAGSGAHGDGALLELGYYNTARVGDPFRGTWIVLAASSIGDDGIEIAGSFSTHTILEAGNNPALTANTPLSIRFYNGTSAANASFFNAASNSSGAWNFVTPADPSPVINLVIDKTNDIVFEDGGSGAFRTVLPIPEPSVKLLVIVAGAVGFFIRKRK